MWGSKANCWRGNRKINGGQKLLNMVVRAQPLAQQVPKLLPMGRKRGAL